MGTCIAVGGFQSWIKYGRWFVLLPHSAESFTLADMIWDWTTVKFKVAFIYGGVEYDSLFSSSLTRYGHVPVSLTFLRNFLLKILLHISRWKRATINCFAIMKFRKTSFNRKELTVIYSQSFFPFLFIILSR